MNGTWTTSSPPSASARRERRDPRGDPRRRRPPLGCRRQPCPLASSSTGSANPPPATTPTTKRRRPSPTATSRQCHDRRRLVGLRVVGRVRGRHRAGRLVAGPPPSRSRTRTRPSTTTRTTEIAMNVSWPGLVWRDVAGRGRVSVGEARQMRLVAVGLAWASPGVASSAISCQGTAVGLCHVRPRRAMARRRATRRVMARQAKPWQSRRGRSRGGLPWFGTPRLVTAVEVRRAAIGVARSAPVRLGEVRQSGPGTEGSGRPWSAAVRSVQARYGSRARVRTVEQRRRRLRPGKVWRAAAVVASRPRVGSGGLRHAP